jgi:DNA uptake protein ComE-like DNA-binding protein
MSVTAEADLGGDRGGASVAGFILALPIGLFLAAGFAVAPLTGTRGASGVRLERTVNPNIDPPASLARLPRIGLTRAHALVSYRRQRQQDGYAAFCEPNDLQRVTGIGPKTVEGIEPWLRFDAETCPTPTPSEGP